MFYFLFHSIPWMTEKEQSKKLCITLFIGTLCYFLTWVFLFNKRDDHFVHKVIYYSIVLIVILDLAMLIYSYKEMKNRNLSSKKELEKAEEELKEINDPPTTDEQIKSELNNISARIIQKWWIGLKGSHKKIITI